MIDDIFKIRFIEEVSKIAEERDKAMKRKSRAFAIVSYVLAVGSTFGAVDYMFDVFIGYKPLDVFYASLIVILGGFASTFLLTFIIFALAYLKVDRIRSCFHGLKCSADNEKLSPGDEVNVTVRFRLLKRELSDVKLTLSCRQEKLVRIVDVESVRIATLHESVTVLGESLTPKKEEYLYEVKLSVPEDALTSQPELKYGADKIMWDISVDFDFLDWHAYGESIPITVV